MRTSTSLALTLGLLAPLTAFAQNAGTTMAGSIQWGLAFAFLGVATATFLSCIGSIIGVSLTGQAGAGLLTEKQELAGKVITLMVLPGSQGLYGMVISLLFIFNYGAVINGDVVISLSKGITLFVVSLPVAFTCLTSAPYQAKVCAAGMHMLAKDDKLAGRVITMAALVETYALLGFLISFFMLNSFKAGLLG